MSTLARAVMSAIATRSRIAARSSASSPYEAGISHPASSTKTAPRRDDSRAAGERRIAVLHDRSLSPRGS